MGDLAARLREIKIREAVLLLTGQKGIVLPEPVATSEQVIAIVRKEGMSIAPNDMQCRADVKGKRCKKEITFNMGNHTWSQMCEKHDAQNEAARDNEATKVLKFVDEA